MDVESEVWDEIAERLVVIYNHIRLTQSDLDQHDRAATKCKAEIARLEAKASHYEALFASEVEGTSA